MKRWTVVGCVAGLVVVAGCAGPGASAPGASATTTATTTAATSAVSLATVDPCSLLSSSEAADIALDPHGEAMRVNGARGCAWHGSVYSATVSIQPSQGLSALSGADPSAVQLTRHPAVERQDGDTGACLVAIGISTTSRVDVDVTGEDYVVAQCAHADGIARLIEPRMPAS